MIGKLRGVVDSLDDESLILDVNGVGYLVAASAHTLRALPRVGELAELMIETHVREDAIRLYGFVTASERDWFRLLQSVQGVGAKVALGVLGALKPDELSTAIGRQDKTMMARAPGVGPKLAARLVLELKDKAPALGPAEFGGRSLSVRQRARAAEGRRGRDPRPGRTRVCPRAGGGGDRAMFRRARRRGADGRAHPGGAEGTGAVNGTAAPRRFFAPLIGLMLLFAALGPPIGGALFVPLAVILKPPLAAGALTGSALIAAVLGHTIMLIAAYVVGVGPAAATGLIYALWDAAAPERWPRALAAAIIGGAVTDAVALRIAAVGGSVGFTIQGNFDARTADWIDTALSGGIGGALTHAFVFSGAIAGLACAMAASLFGLTMQPLPARAANGGTA